MSFLAGFLQKSFESVLPKTSRDKLFTILAVGVQVLFQLFYVKSITVFIDQEVFGNYVILNIFVSLITQVTLSVPSASFHRYFNESVKSDIVREYRLTIFYVLALFVFMLLAHGFFYSGRYSALAYVLIFCNLALSSLFSVNQQVVLLELQRGRYFLLKVMESLSMYVFPVLTYLYFRQLESFIGGVVLGSALCFVVSQFLVNRRLGKSAKSFVIPKENIVKYLRYGYPILFSAAASWTISMSDRYFVDYYFGVERVAQYSILVQFSGFGLVLGMLFSSYVNPIVLKQYSADRCLGLKSLKRYLIGFGGLLMVIGGFLCALPSQFLAIFLSGEIIEEAGGHITYILLVISVMMTVYQTAISLYFVLLEALTVYAVGFLGAAAINFVLNFYFVRFGLLGVALTTLIAYSALLTYIFYFLMFQKERLNAQAGSAST
jgi:O-antigen/teichoic acid export membrane protein